MLPVAVKAWRSGLTMDAIIGSFAMTSSFLYHSMRALGVTFGPVDDGRFHVADNVFAIASFCFAIIQVLQLDNLRVNESLKVSALAVAIVSQCLSPWDIRFTLYPIFGTLIVVSILLLLRRRKLTIAKRCAVVSAIFLVLALIFFNWGLDETNDPILFYHGCWHVCGSVFMYYLIAALSPPSVASRREAAVRAYREAYAVLEEQKVPPEQRKVEVVGLPPPSAQTGIEGDDVRLRIVGSGGQPPTLSALVSPMWAADDMSAAAGDDSFVSFRRSRCFDDKTPPAPHSGPRFVEVGSGG